MPNMSAKEWDRLLNFASMQGVLPIITPLFANYETNNTQLRSVLVQWCAVSLQSAAKYKLRTNIMRELAKLFAEEDIDVMFIKGTTLAQLYPNPESRMFSDIDFFLFGKSDQGIKAMARHGIDNSEYYHHHTQASLNGVLLENHYDFVERVNHKCDIILDDALKDLAVKEGHSLQVDFLGDAISNAYQMTPTMNAIFLMRHMSAHFVSETVPLRMLYDWALFLEKRGEDVDWPMVLKLYEESGMMRFAEIIQQMLLSHLSYQKRECPIAFGNVTDAEKVWQSIVNPPVRDPHKKFTLRYYLFEAHTFFANRWKHKLVYPGESFVGLFFKYVRHGVKMMVKKKAH